MEIRGKTQPNRAPCSRFHHIREKSVFHVESSDPVSNKIYYWYSIRIHLSQSVLPVSAPKALM